jgi:hypothetical protein
MIIDPKVEAAVRAGMAPQLQVATPINDVQLVVLAAAAIYDKSFDSGYLGAREAVATARRIFVEALVQAHEEPLAALIDQRLSELHPSEQTPAGQQFVIPGTR